MQYLTRDSREVYIYEFATKKKSTLLTFAKRDGIISHMRFLGDSLFYVKNTKDIVRYDMRKHSAQIIGTTREAVIAVHVSCNHIREADNGEEEKIGGNMGGGDEIDEEN